LYNLYYFIIVILLVTALWSLKLAVYNYDNIIALIICYWSSMDRWQLLWSPYV